MSPEGVNVVGAALAAVPVAAAGVEEDIRAVLHLVATETAHHLVLRLAPRMTMIVIVMTAMLMGTAMEMVSVEKSMARPT